MPEMLDLSLGGDMRCFILDNRRPFHLANVYSNYNVVLLDDGFVDGAEDDVPSDGSELDPPVHQDADVDSEQDDDDEDEEAEYVSSDEDQLEGVTKIMCDECNW